jgi:hypothetical protein
MSKNMPIMFKTTDEYKALSEFTNTQIAFITSLQHTLKERKIFTNIHSLVTQLSQQLEEFAKEKNIGSITHKQNQQILIKTLAELRESYTKLTARNKFQKFCDEFITKLQDMDFPQKNLSLAGILARYRNALLKNEKQIITPKETPGLPFQ